MIVRKYGNPPNCSTAEVNPARYRKQSSSKHTNMNIDNFPVHTSQDWKFGLITREIYRVSEDQFEINDLSDGWLTAIVDNATIQGLMNGNISLTSLNWQ